MRLSAFFLVTLFAAAAMAQEFARSSGGEIAAITKSGGRLSGSFGITRSNGGLGNLLKGYDATLGGTLLKDRAWFFASARLQDRFAPAAVQPQVSFDRAAFVKATAPIAGQHLLNASFGSGPASFLSLRYDAAVTSNMLFSASVSSHEK